MPELKPEDYKEPNCPFCTDFYEPEQNTVKPVDLRRILEKLDEHLSRNDYAAAERHLNYWQQEAQAGNDARGLLSIENERMGLYRKLDRKADATGCADAALALVKKAGLENTVTAATTYLNIATVHKNFNESDLALPLYLQAREIYERELSPKDDRLGGLYNNMALALVDLGDYAQARALYAKALAIMETADHGALEMAITELNLANLAEAELGLLQAEAEIEQHLNRAQALLEQPTLEHNGYYAFVCEKCAPTFGYYGRFAYAGELAALAEELYARN